MEKRYYLVEANGKHSGLLTNRKLADGVAKKYHGVVWAANQRTFDGGMMFGIDYPTFKAQADVVADFRNTPEAQMLRDFKRSEKVED